MLYAVFCVKCSELFDWLNWRVLSFPFFLACFECFGSLILVFLVGKLISGRKVIYFPVSFLGNYNQIVIIGEPSKPTIKADNSVINKACLDCLSFHI